MESGTMVMDVQPIGSTVNGRCGEGHCAGYFAELGCDVLGIDGSAGAAENSVIPASHMVHDFADGPCFIARDYDLAWSCEFVEHVEEKYVDNFLQVFLQAKKYIALTYATPGQPGWHHVNCQPEVYWIEKINAIGYTFDRELTTLARTIAAHEHFHRKGLVFTTVQVITIDTPYAASRSQQVPWLFECKARKAE